MFADDPALTVRLDDALISRQPLRVVVGLYGAWLFLFGVPAFFARKLAKIAPLPEADPNQPRPCGRCGTTLAPGTRACHYCGAALS